LDNPRLLWVLERPHPTAWRPVPTHRLAADTPLQYVRRRS
jgi:hypothetical protein